MARSSEERDVESAPAQLEAAIDGGAKQLGVQRSIDAAATLQLERLLAEDAGAAPAKHDKAGSGLTYSGSVAVLNDSIPAPNLLLPRDRMYPRSDQYSDDDGRTFSARADLTVTDEHRNRQLVASSQYEMLTQDGAQEDPHRNRRADLLNNLIQVNRRFDLGDGRTFYAGAGIGAQTVGDLGGLRLQNWFHHKGGMGGRWEGWGLQDNYGELQGRSATSPAVSLGAGVEKATHGDSKWQADATASVEGVAGMGSHGMSALQLKAGGRVGYAGVADVEAKVTSSMGFANGQYLRWAPLNRGQLGYEVALHVHLLERLGVPIEPYVMLSSNTAGFSDTVYTLGFVIGGGARPWLNSGP